MVFSANNNDSLFPEKITRKLVFGNGLLNCSGLGMPKNVNILLLTTKPLSQGCGWYKPHSLLQKYEWQCPQIITMLQTTQ